MTNHFTASILVVDDHPTNLGVLFDHLQLAGFKVLTAEDGETALKRVGHFKPDLILLDIMMPGIDGFETCRRFKADKDLQDIPIIFMTALTDAVDKVKGFAAGAVDYVTKPVDVSEVLARIQTHLTLRNLQQELQLANHQLTEQVQELDRLNVELQARNSELEEALATIKTLSGFVPLCAWCHQKVRNDHNEWIPLEIYIQEHTEAQITHGMCTDCAQKFWHQG
jgi:DNA-binding response OmpR family regulator